MTWKTYKCFQYLTMTCTCLYFALLTLISVEVSWDVDAFTSYNHHSLTWKKKRGSLSLIQHWSNFTQLHSENINRPCYNLKMINWYYRHARTQSNPNLTLLFCVWISPYTDTVNNQDTSGISFCWYFNLSAKKCHVKLQRVLQV